MQIQDIKSKIDQVTKEIHDSPLTNEARTKFLGKNGIINSLTTLIPKLDQENRGEGGKLINQIKKTAVEHFQSINESKKMIDKSYFDPTVPGLKPSVGSLHPLTKVIHEIEEIFKRFGFHIATGPEIEWDEINFQMLRLGPDHPSRDTQETYYFDENRLLRVHTSSVQIRYMTKNKPPIRIISPGRVYRRDTIDATHLPMFHQIEGLMVDDQTTLNDLLGILEYAVKALFGEDKNVRFYGHNFPYTEPSLEVEVETENGKWMEILGCGMVHPQVLENCGIDSRKYQGWAFGMGADRLAMLKYGIQDIRTLIEGDLRVLNI